MEAYLEGGGGTRIVLKTSMEEDNQCFTRGEKRTVSPLNWNDPHQSCHPKHPGLQLCTFMCRGILRAICCSDLFYICI